MVVKKVSAKSVVVKSGIPTVEYAVNPYGGCPHKCLYCYAEFMKRFTNHSEDWGDFVDVKEYDFEKRPLKVEQYAGKTVLFGSVTDCYNIFEKKYENTRTILKKFVDFEGEVSIVTKSSLVVRDIDLLQQIKNVEVGFSFSSLDENFQRVMEAGASSPEEKLSAVRVLSEAGVKTWVFISPFFPEITDYKAVIEKCRPYTNNFAFERLKLRSLYKKRVLQCIKEHYPTVFPLYERLFCQNGDGEYFSAKKKEIVDYGKKEGLVFDIFFETDHKEKSY